MHKGPLATKTAQLIIIKTINIVFVNRAAGGRREADFGPSAITQHQTTADAVAAKEAPHPGYLPLKADLEAMMINACK